MVPSVYRGLIGLFDKRRSACLELYTVPFQFLYLGKEVDQWFSLDPDYS